jgi:hypothetical protein
VYFRMAAARRSAASRSRTAGATQWAAAWVVLSQGAPHRGQALGLQGRPPQNVLRAAAISRAALEVSLWAKEPPGSRGQGRTCEITKVVSGNCDLLIRKLGLIKITG